MNILYPASQCLIYKIVNVSLSKWIIIANITVTVVWSFVSQYFNIKYWNFIQFITDEVLSPTGFEMVKSLASWLNLPYLLNLLNLPSWIKLIILLSLLILPSWHWNSIQNLLNIPNSQLTCPADFIYLSFPAHGIRKQTQAFKTTAILVAQKLDHQVHVWHHFTHPASDLCFKIVV